MLFRANLPHLNLNSAGYEVSLSSRVV